MLFNKVPWACCFRVFIWRGAHHIIQLRCVGMLPWYNLKWFCFSKKAFNQPAVLLRKAVGWMRFWAHDNEEVCLSSKVMHGQNHQPVPRRKVSHADEVMSFFGDFLSKAFLQSFFYYLFFCRHTSLSKTSFMWKHKLTFRSCSGVKVVWYRTTLK